MVGRIEGFIDDQVDGMATARPDVALGGVKVHIGGDRHARFDQQGCQDVFSRPTLVGGYKMLKTENLLHGFLQAEERARPGVGFIATHDGRPLLLAHGAGAGIGQQVDKHFFCP